MKNIQELLVNGSSDEVDQYVKKSIAEELEKLKRIKSAMKPTTRKDLALMVPDGGLMIELGVAAGKFAELLLDTNPNMGYVGIDRWSDHHDEAEMMAAIDRVGARAELIRATFAEVADSIDDEIYDLIYIDGYAHTGQEGGETLRDWWPKLKPGGIFAGHDYCQQYPQTIAAVDAFVAEHGLDLNIIDELPHPSWWVKKPG